MGARQSIVRFEPGDATSYQVMFRFLTADEAGAVGGFSAADTPVLFAFGARGAREWRAHVFQSDGFLHAGYYQTKMGEDQPWTAIAGLIVLGYLSGREIGGSPEDDHRKAEVLGAWRGDWQYELLPLVGGR